MTPAHRPAARRRACGARRTARASSRARLATTMATATIAAATSVATTALRDNATPFIGPDGAGAREAPRRQGRGPAATVQSNSASVFTWPTGPFGARRRDRYADGTRGEVVLRGGEPADPDAVVDVVEADADALAFGRDLRRGTRGRRRRGADGGRRRAVDRQRADAAARRPRAERSTNRSSRPARSSERRTAAVRSAGGGGAACPADARRRAASAAIACIDASCSRSCGRSARALRMPDAAGSHNDT